MIDVHKGFNPAAPDENIQRGLRQPLDVHRFFAHKMGELPQALHLAVRVVAVHRFGDALFPRYRALCLMYPGGFSAAGAGGGIHVVLEQAKPARLAFDAKRAGPGGRVLFMQIVPVAFPSFAPAGADAHMAQPVFLKFRRHLSKIAHEGEQAAVQVCLHMGNDLISLAHQQPAAGHQAQVLDKGQVVQAGPGNLAAVNLNRIKDRYRGNLPGPGGRPFDIPEPALEQVVLELKRQPILEMVSGAAAGF